MIPYAACTRLLEAFCPSGLLLPVRALGGGNDEVQIFFLMHVLIEHACQAFRMTIVSFLLPCLHMAPQKSRLAEQHEREGRHCPAHTLCAETGVACRR